MEEGARFNDVIHRLPTGNQTFIPKGVFWFNRHEDANRHQQDCLVEGMAQIALGRSLIVATVLEAGCDTLYSEDMQDGQVIEDRLRIITPFA